MKVTVINNSESVIYNGKIYGYEQSFDVDETIGKSLIDRGYVAETSSHNEVKPVEEQDEEVIDTAESNDLEDMSYQELKRMASQLGLDATGKKDELIARINAYNSTEEYICDDGDLPNTSMPD